MLSYIQIIPHNDFNTEKQSHVSVFLFKDIHYICLKSSTLEVHKDKWATLREHAPFLDDEEGGYWH